MLSAAGIDMGEASFSSTSSAEPTNEVLLLEWYEIFDLEVDIHIVEGLVALALIVGPLVIRTCGHNKWEFRLCEDG